MAYAYSGPKQKVGAMPVLQKWLCLALLHIFAALPQPIKKIIATVSEWLLYYANGRIRKITERNLAICFRNVPEEARTQLVRKSMFELSLGILDLARCWIWKLQDLEQEVTGVVGSAHFRAAVTNGRGTLVLLPHLGSWELANLILNKDHTITTLYLEPNSAVIGDLIRRYRQRTGAKMVPIGTPGLRAVLEALRSNEMVSLLPDQVPPPQFGKFAPFFGEPTLTMTLATNLIQRTGAKAVCAYCKRLPRGKYELVFLPVDDAIYDPECSVAVAALNRSIERCVLDCVEQYQWAYKRFKILPNLQKRNYLETPVSGNEDVGHRQA